MTDQVHSAQAPPTALSIEPPETWWRGLFSFLRNSKKREATVQQAPLTREADTTLLALDAPGGCQGAVTPRHCAWTDDRSGVRIFCLMTPEPKSQWCLGHRP